MPRKRFSVEQIINHLHLREAEVLLAQGQTVGEVCRHIGVSEQKLLSLAPGVRWPEARPGPSPEGAGAGEHPSSSRGC